MEPGTEWVPSGSVERRRLLDRLAGRSERRLILIIASAGFGKTTVLRQAIGESAARTAIDPATPLDVPVTVPRDGLDAASLLDRFGKGLDGTAISSADQLVDAVWSRSPQGICLIVDDIQWLEHDAMELVGDLLERLPANGHLVLVGREDPPIPFHRLMSTGDADRIDEADLAFDPDELHAFARLHAVPADRLGSSRWPALVELERLTGRSGAVRYLVEEVVNSIDPDRLRWCRRLAVHHTLDDDLVRRTTAFNGGAAALFAGIPLTVVDPLARPTASIRVHDLVREALLSGLDPDERSSAEVEMGTALAERADHEGALDRFVEAARPDRIRWLARLLASELHFADAANTRRLLVGRIRTHLGDTVEAAVVDAVVAAVEDPVRARPRLVEAADRARRGDDAELEAACVLQLADIAYSAADLDAVRCARDRLGELADAGCRPARRTLFLPEAWVRCLTDRHVEVVDLVDELRRSIDPVEDPELDQLLLLYRVLNLAYSGHVRAALDEAAQLRSLPGGLFANRLAGFELIQRWHLGELDDSWRTHVVSLVDRIEAQGQIHLFLQGAASCALFHVSSGDVATARSLVERAERHLHRLPPTAWAHHSVALARAAITVCDGDEPAAIEILERSVPAGGVTVLPRFIYGAAATLTYVLVPRTRPEWDADRGGPDHEIRRDVARALVALREDGTTELAARLPWHRPELIRPWAFGPHLVEIAVAAIDAGVHSASTTLDTASHDPRHALDRLAARSDHVLARRARTLAEATPHRPAHHLHISVLGPLELRHDGRGVTDERWDRRQRVRDLLALLVDRRRIERTELAVTLWPEKSADAAASNLRFTLSQLISVLEPERRSNDRPWFIRTVGSRIELTGGDLLTIDVDRFTDAAHSAGLADRSGSPERALHWYVDACNWYRGDYLTGVSEPEWGFYEGLRLRGIFLEAATRASQLLTSIGELDQAEQLAGRAAATEPFHEGAATALARVMLARHRPGAARDVLGALLTELERAGLEPEPSTSAVARRVGLDLTPG